MTIYYFLINHWWVVFSCVLELVKLGYHNDTLSGKHFRFFSCDVSDFSFFFLIKDWFHKLFRKSLLIFSLCLFLIVHLLHHSSYCILSRISQGIACELLCFWGLSIAPKNLLNTVFNWLIHITFIFINEKAQLLVWSLLRWVKLLVVFALVVGRAYIVLCFWVDYLWKLKPASTRLKFIKSKFKLLKLFNFWLKVHLFHFLEECSKLQVIGVVVLRLLDAVSEPSRYLRPVGTVQVPAVQK